MYKTSIKILLFVFIIAFYSCEKDDICIEENTPHLIIRFYDKVNTSETKNVEQLKVSVKNSLDEIIDIGAITTTDSIVIPLNVDLDNTQIILSKNTNGTNDNIDGFTLNYMRDEIFISRSCGYKILYKDIQINNLATNDWIENIARNNTNIENETAAHLSIFH